MSPPLHLHPINVIVFDDPKKSNLVAGFVLRCFQHLSDPDLDTPAMHLAAQPVNQRVRPTRSSRSGVESHANFIALID